MLSHDYACRAPKVSLDHPETKESEGSMVSLENPVLMDLLVRMERREDLDHPDSLDLPDQRAREYVTLSSLSSPL